MKTEQELKYYSDADMEIIGLSLAILEEEKGADAMEKSLRETAKYIADYNRLMTELEYLDKSDSEEESEKEGNNKEEGNPGSLPPDHDVMYSCGNEGYTSGPHPSGPQATKCACGAYRFEDA